MRVSNKSDPGAFLTMKVKAMIPKPVMLVILDGWGIRESSEHNAIAQAHTPHYDSLLAEYPHTRLDASGRAVGLPAGVMGNSEVGHLNMGAGRIAQVGLTRIYHSIEEGSFFQNSALLEAMNAARSRQSCLHLLGLVSDGAVHSHQDHLYALLEMAKRQGVTRIAVHAFTDGRDTDPHSGLGYLQALEKKIQEIGVGALVSIMGRYYAMDRDQRWERTQRAYDALVNGEGQQVGDWVAAVKASYEGGVSDEFLEPMVLRDEQGRPKALLQDGDSAIFFNFRADRARQLTRALTDPKFSGFPRKSFPQIEPFICMAEYDASLGLPVAFSPVEIHHTFGEVVAAHGLSQLRIAETEKYAHVTFFFNGGRESIFPGEERILVPSPREVPTYDYKPEMSAPQITDRVLEAICSQKFDVIVLNFANADMVGHTGNLTAAIRAVEVLDTQLGRIEQEVRRQGGVWILTADHGNCEKMSDEQGRPHTAHTTDWVPFILVGEDFKTRKLRASGSLADVAPTLLEILQIPAPSEMSGQSLLLS